jgi:tripartite-type tricarboxylate transporter receptor subunit TctC
VLVVNASQPMKSLADYVAAAKVAPGQLNYGSAGVGSNLHLAMELLKYRTGIQVTHVPYKGVGPALQDTLAGHVMSMISNIPSSKPHIADMMPMALSYRKERGRQPTASMAFNSMAVNSAIMPRALLMLSI